MHDTTSPTRGRDRGPPPGHAGTKAGSRLNIVLRYVTDRIAAGTLKAGDKLPNEAELAEQIGVSRTPVREALKTLSIAGLVESRHGYGTYLREGTGTPALQMMLFQLHLQKSTPQMLMELRAVVDRSCAELAATRRSDDDLSEMRDCIERLRALSADPGSPIDLLLEADLDFHRAIYVAARNELVETVARFILDMVAPWIRRSLEASGRTRAVRLHEMLYAMIEEGNTDGVRDFHSVDANMEHFRQSLELPLPPDATPDAPAPTPKRRSTRKRPGTPATRQNS